MRARDRGLLTDVLELVSEQTLLRHSVLEIDVRGGVVHVRGDVPSALAQARLRKVVSRLRGVHALWDVVQVDGQAPPTIVDIGCGANKQCRDSIGVDRYAGSGVDLVADLEHGLPLADASVDHLFAVHFLEHVRELLPLANEMHRVLRSAGVLHVMVPHRHFANAWADPTHVRFFEPQTFKFFCRPYPRQRMFFPLLVSAAEDNVFADLQPVGEERPPATPEELGRFFD